MLHLKLIPLASLFACSIPLARAKFPFLLTWRCPSSLVSDQLFTPCCSTLPEDTPRFMLHVYIGDITTLSTLSDTDTFLPV
jgi:hypothetical protein